ncbi:hypothetical protein SNEBB_008559 [Seison nebaliae]|nr:hypothetical protein SNEBB_008559 [Seison nebaliae]
MGNSKKQQKKSYLNNLIRPELLDVRTPPTSDDEIMSGRRRKSRRKDSGGKTKRENRKNYFRNNQFTLTLNNINNNNNGAGDYEELEEEETSEFIFGIEPTDRFIRCVALCNEAVTNIVLDQSIELRIETLASLEEDKLGNYKFFHVNHHRGGNDSRRSTTSLYVDMENVRCNISACRIAGGSNRFETSYRISHVHNPWSGREEDRRIFCLLVDGHKGGETGLHVNRYLIDNICRQRLFWNEQSKMIKQSLRLAVLYTQVEMWKIFHKWEKTDDGFANMSGCSLTLLVVVGQRVFSVQLGITKSIIGIAGERGLTPQTLVQRHTCEAEKEYIINNGGLIQKVNRIDHVVWCRTNEILKGKNFSVIYHLSNEKNPKTSQVPFVPISRSLGNFWCFHRKMMKFIISPEPEIAEVNVDYKIHRAIVIINTNISRTLNKEPTDNLFHVDDETDAAQFLLSRCEKIRGDSTKKFGNLISLYLYFEGNETSPPLVVKEILPDYSCELKTDVSSTTLDDNQTNSLILSLPISHNSPTSQPPELSIPILPDPNDLSFHSNHLTNSFIPPIQQNRNQLSFQQQQQQYNQLPFQHQHNPFPQPPPPPPPHNYNFCIPQQQQQQFYSPYQQSDESSFISNFNVSQQNSFQFQHDSNQQQIFIQQQQQGPPPLLMNYNGQQSVPYYNFQQTSHCRPNYQMNNVVGTNGYHSYTPQNNQQSYYYFNNSYPNHNNESNSVNISHGSNHPSMKTNVDSPYQLYDNPQQQQQQQQPSPQPPPTLISVTQALTQMNYIQPPNYFYDRPIIDSNNSNFPPLLPPPAAPTLTDVNTSLPFEMTPPTQLNEETSYLDYNSHFHQQYFRTITSHFNFRHCTQFMPAPYISQIAASVASCSLANTFTTPSDNEMDNDKMCTMEGDRCQWCTKQREYQQFWLLMSEKKFPDIFREMNYDLPVPFSQTTLPMLNEIDTSITTTTSLNIPVETFDDDDESSHTKVISPSPSVITIITGCSRTSLDTSCVLDIENCSDGASASTTTERSDLVRDP